MWAALAVVDANAAYMFREDHCGPWPHDGEPWFIFDPKTCVLVLDAGARGKGAVG